MNSQQFNNAINTLIVPAKAIKIFEQMLNTQVVEENPEKYLFMNVLRGLKKEEFIQNYAALSEYCSVIHVDFLIENEFLDKEYIAYLYVESEYIKNKTYRENRESLFNAFEARGYYKDLLSKDNLFIIDYAINNAKVAFLLEHLADNNARELLDSLDKIEKNLNNDDDIFEYLTKWHDLSLIDNTDKGLTVVERLDKLNKTKYMGERSLELLSESLYFEDKEQPAKIFFKKLSRKNQKFLVTIDSYFEEINEIIIAEKERAILNKTFDNTKIKLKKPKERF